MNRWSKPFCTSLRTRSFAASMPSASQLNPACFNFSVVFASGTQPAYDAGWALESALDVEWAHAVAPLADGPQWFERLYGREPNLMKIVLTPGNPS